MTPERKQHLRSLTSGTPYLAEVLDALDVAVRERDGHAATATRLREEIEHYRPDALAARALAVARDHAVERAEKLAHELAAAIHERADAAAAYADKINDATALLEDVRRRLVDVIRERDAIAAANREYEAPRLARVLEVDTLLAEVAEKTGELVEERRPTWEALEKMGAKNCLESIMSFEGSDFVVTCQRKGGKTPMQLRTEALEERDAAIARVETATTSEKTAWTRFEQIRESYKTASRTYGAVQAERNAAQQELKNVASALDGMRNDRDHARDMLVRQSAYADEVRTKLAAARAEIDRYKATWEEAGRRFDHASDAAERKNKILLAERDAAVRERDEAVRARKVIMDDLRQRGLLREACLGCGRWTDERDCGCPAGTSTSLDVRRIVPLGADTETTAEEISDQKARTP